MPIPTTCTCGVTYQIKDEFAGKYVRCPKCSEVILVGTPGSTASPPRAAAQQAPPQAGDVFSRDKFLLRQKHLAIKEKYYVWDEKGQALLYIERPAHAFRNLLAALAGLIAAGVVFALLLNLNSFFQPPAALVMGVLEFLLSVAAFFAVFLLLYRKRHVNVYPDDKKSETLLQVLQEKKVEILNATFRVQDAGGKLLARLRKNYLRSLFRKRWDCYARDGSLLCVAKEDSIILALLRRLLGRLFGLLRVNFVIYDGQEKNVMGEFNRKFTLLDRYVLDMSPDPERVIDRRIALALGVMLDTGERR